MNRLNSTTSSQRQRTRQPSFRRGNDATIGSPRHEGAAPATGSGVQHHYRRDSTMSSSDANMIDDREMLWRLVDEAETNLVAYSEEVGVSLSGNIH